MALGPLRGAAGGGARRTLAVLPDERGAGVGHALLEEPEGIARKGGAETVVVGLVQINDVAQVLRTRGLRSVYLEMVADLREG